MRISIYQSDIIWLNPFANLQNVEGVCYQLMGKVDVLVLPEMFNTGYILDTNLIQSTWQDDTILRLQKLAKETEMAIAGSIPMKIEGKFFNTFIFVTKDGQILTYNKIHLFSLAGENQHYSAGNEVITFEYLGLNIMPFICYDLRFPYLPFSSEVKPDVILYVANWPTTRIQHWKSLLVARAIENQAFVVGVNRVGADPNGYQYSGNSMIVNFDGETLDVLNDETLSEIVYLDIKKAQQYRQKFPFRKDSIWPK